MHLEMTQPQLSSTFSEDESSGDDPAADIVVADTETNDYQVGMYNWQDLFSSHHGMMKINWRCIWR